MKQEVHDIADLVSQELNADVVFYNGDISQPDWISLKKVVSNRKIKRENALLVLVTPGGDPDAAYKIARLFQRSYIGFWAFIPGWCKSAGTLIAMASSTLYVGDTGELGPLDIQLAKQDELDEMASGLLMDATMKTLESTASRMFISLLKTVRKETGISTRFAAELSAKMVVGLLDPVFAQVEPMKVGENARAMNITRAYGARLSQSAKSLHAPQMLDYLVNAYPDHGFVIDREEASYIFRDVREPTADMARLASALGERALIPKLGVPGAEGALIEFLSSEKPIEGVAEGEINGADEDQVSKPDGRNQGEGKRSGGSSGKRTSRTLDNADESSLTSSGSACTA